MEDFILFVTQHVTTMIVIAVQLVNRWLKQFVGIFQSMIFITSIKIGYDQSYEKLKIASFQLQFRIGSYERSRFGKICGSLLGRFC